ncbi:hypothetical protein [Phenylobacterium sp.]|jgi:hypothetical protein|uniref:hypothetical protein n=1 Tax=Phenylobacterium sp. TaxID=1871053 RepID=UPI002F4292C2
MERRGLVIAIAAAAAATAAATAATAAPQSRTPGCFFVRDIGDRTVGGPHTLYFKVKDQSHMHAVAYFHVETRGYCNTGPISDDQHHAFRVGSTRLAAGNAAMICRADELIITGLRGCAPDTIERMTPQEVAALPPLIRP